MGVRVDEGRSEKAVSEVLVDRATGGPLDDRRDLSVLDRERRRPHAKGVGFAENDIACVKGPGRHRRTVSTIANLRPSRWMR